MLGQIQPLNEVTEKEKFMSAWRQGKIYNPVFEYANPDYCRQLLAAFDAVLYFPDYADLAETILFEIIEKYGSAAGYKDAVWGSSIEPTEAMNRALLYTRRHNIRTKVFFGTSLVTTMGNKGLSLVGTPGYYRDLRLNSLLDHELSVHFLRSQNHKLLDPDVKARIRSARADYVDARLPVGTDMDIRKKIISQMITLDEEGLACVVTNRSYSNCQKFFQPALSSFTVHLAKSRSFYECFQTLFQRRLCVDENDAWIQVLRSKRGLTDTSRPGAFCKDSLNFVGAIRVLQNINNMDIRVFFSAKLRCEEYFEFKDELARHYRRNIVPSSKCLQLPYFLSSDAGLSEFNQVIQRMKKDNYVSEPQPLR